MKEAFDKEIDSLLRRHAGAGAEARAGGENQRAAQKPAHLDADELSAFAEGALPAGARLAAVSHLADCEECRGLAVNLARAAGAEGVLEKRAASASVRATSSRVQRRSPVSIASTRRRTSVCRRVRRRLAVASWTPSTAPASFRRSPSK